MKDKLIYLAIFDYGEDGITVTFPDFPGCFTFGKDDAEAVKNAEKALGLHIYGMQQDGDAIPECSKGYMLHTDENQRIFLVQTNMAAVRMEIKPVYVKKTLTIRAGLNRAAQDAGINFSAVLNDTLEKMLGAKA